MQAFGRVFRLGQNKETYFRRIVVDFTVDNRLVALQEKKVHNISKVIESGGKRKLSLEETLSLFGRVEKSEGGKLRVLSDDEKAAELDESDSEEDEDQGGESDEDYECDEDSGTSSC